MPPPKVLHVLPQAARGGAEHLVAEVVAEINRQGRWSAETCVLVGERGTRGDGAGGGVHGLGLRHRYDPRAAARLEALVAGRGFDVVHSHLFPANLATARIPERRSPPCVMTEHSIDNRRRHWRLARSIDRRVYSRFSTIVCVSDAVRAALLEWDAGQGAKCEVVPNAVTILEPAVVERTLDVLCVGNLARRAKGVDVLLEAVALAGERIGSVAVAGDGLLREELERQSDRLGLHRKVSFLGSVAGPRRLMRTARVFVLPSRWEGMPMALLEAMEAGLPVVASSVGGIPEVVRDGWNGVLVPPESPPALSAAITGLLEDPSRARRLGRRARRTIVEGFSIEHHATRLVELYDRLAARTARPGDGRRA